MKAVFHVKDGKVVVDTKKDELLYGTPCNPPNTGTRYTRGTSVYVHRSKKGKVYFYFYHWSMWQGEEDSLELASPEEVGALLEKWLPSPWGPTEEQLQRYEELTGINLLEETA